MNSPSHPFPSDRLRNPAPYQPNMQLLVPPTQRVCASLPAFQMDSSPPEAGSTCTIFMRWYRQWEGAGKFP